MILETEIVAERDSPIGAWHLHCPSCPMHPYQKAIDVKLQQCRTGIQTNMQGAIPLGQCQHAVKFDGLKVDCKSTVKRLEPQSRQGGDNG